MFARLYIRVLLGLATIAGVFYASTKAGHLLSSPSDGSVALGGFILISSVFLGGWILGKIIRGGVRNESASGRSAGVSNNDPAR